MVHDIATEVDLETGEFAYSTVVIIVQRQAGKTALFHPLAAHRALTGFDRLCWYTAQSRQDARENLFDGFVPLLRRSPLSSLIKVRESQGSEGIHFPTGSSYRIFSPVPDALHGKANHLVGLDEGWAYGVTLGDALVQAIMPTFATVDGQLWIFSAAGTAESVWLRSYVESGRATVDAGRRDTLCYIEFGIPDDADPSDIDVVAANHPAYGHTLRLGALRAAQATMKPGEYARAYGNRWTGVAERVIAEAIWRPAQVYPHAGQMLAPASGNVVLAIEAGLDQTDAAIVAVWRDPARHSACRAAGSPARHALGNPAPSRAGGDVAPSGDWSWLRRTCRAHRGRMPPHPRVSRIPTGNLHTEVYPGRWTPGFMRPGQA